MSQWNRFSVFEKWYVDLMRYSGDVVTESGMPYLSRLERDDIGVHILRQHYSGAHVSQGENE